MPPHIDASVSGAGLKFSADIGCVGGPADRASGKPPDPGGITGGAGGVDHRGVGDPVRLGGEGDLDRVHPGVDDQEPGIVDERGAFRGVAPDVPAETPPRFAVVL